MKATCPHCGTTYRIDPRKVPAGGVHARCSRCGGVFEVNDPEAAAVASLGGAPAAPPAPAAAPPPAPSYGGGSSTPPQPPPAPTPSSLDDDSEGQVELPPLGAPPRPAPATPPLAARPAASVAAPPAPPPLRAPAPPEQPREQPAPAPPPPPPLFGKPDPHGKARRLARALISDIAVYNPERRDRGLADGTLRQEFREEIRKSWDEYVAQVGDSIARGTPYFREALNEILAGGRAVF